MAVEQARFEAYNFKELIFMDFCQPRTQALFSSKISSVNPVSYINHLQIERAHPPHNSLRTYILHILIKLLTCAYTIHHCIR